MMGHSRTDVKLQVYGLVSAPHDDEFHKKEERIDKVFLPLSFVILIC
jgi:hypothetical protein